MRCPSKPDLHFSSLKCKLFAEVLNVGYRLFPIFTAFGVWKGKQNPSHSPKNSDEAFIMKSTFWGSDWDPEAARLVRLTQTNHCESNDALFLMLGLKERAGQWIAYCIWECCWYSQMIIRGCRSCNECKQNKILLSGFLFLLWCDWDCLQKLFLDVRASAINDAEAVLSVTFLYSMEMCKFYLFILMF